MTTRPFGTIQDLKQMAARTWELRKTAVTATIAAPDLYSATETCQYGLYTNLFVHGEMHIHEDIFSHIQYRVLPSLDSCLTAISRPPASGGP
jgi:hypothetical protein